MKIYTGETLHNRMLKYQCGQPLSTLLKKAKELAAYLELNKVSKIDEKPKRRGRTMEVSMYIKISRQK